MYHEIIGAMTLFTGPFHNNNSYEVNPPPLMVYPTPVPEMAIHVIV